VNVEIHSDNQTKISRSSRVSVLPQHGISTAWRAVFIRRNMKTRKLTVLEHDDGWRRQQSNTAPASEVRLRGQWLTHAGFHPGMTFTASMVSPGVMELRVSGPAQFTSCDWQTAVEPFNSLGL
jgi:hypothetical protein